MLDTALTFDPGDGRGSLPYFYHERNCGLETAPRRTERTVELPIADRWLSRIEAEGEGLDRVVELGAVTPYYWPGRIDRVVDPVDANATQGASLFDVALADCDVLSISTIEHVGERRYGLAESRTPLEALGRIVLLASRLLITFPCGLPHAGAQQLERFVREEQDIALARLGVSVRLLARNADETWSPATSPAGRSAGSAFPYGDKKKPWANAIYVLER